MHYDVLIVGQGLAGSFLSWELHKAGITHLIADQPDSASASRVASGVINPVTGRRMVKTWKIDELMPLAFESYTALGSFLGIQAIRPFRLLDFFPTPQMRLAFTDRIREGGDFLSWPNAMEDWTAYLQFEFGAGEIAPVYLVNLRELLPSYREFCHQQHLLWEEKLDPTLIQFTEDGIRYKDVSASRIIFCDGVAAASLTYFTRLPFAPNKGEVVWVEIPDLPSTAIIKKGYSLVPWKGNQFWLGSTYQWNYEDCNPSRKFYESAENWLKSTMRLPWRILDHKASVRPATLERRPFAGFHPLHPSIGILNGMGTKGCSLAPYLAKQMADFLSKGISLDVSISIDRFRNQLSKISGING